MLLAFTMLSETQFPALRPGSLSLPGRGGPWASAREGALRAEVASSDVRLLVPVPGMSVKAPLTGNKLRIDMGNPLLTELLCPASAFLD